MNNFLTTVSYHLRNDDTNLYYVSYNVLGSPADPLSTSPTQDYPIEKVFSTRQVFTKYSAFEPGDYIEQDGKRFVVQAVNKWAELRKLDTYFQLLVEENVS